MLIVDTHQEVDLFKTPRSMSNWLEAIDVREGEYRVFDCAGVEYAVSAETDSSPVLIGAAIGSDPDLVRDLARRFVGHLRPSRAGIASVDPLVTADDISRALAPLAR